MPGLWNIYFREQVNLSKQLFAREKQKTSDPASRDEEDKARLAEKNYKRLEKGSYEDAQNVRRPIAGDTSKLHWAVGTSVGERRLLQNMEFITKMIPGTQAIRRRMGRLGFSASIIYGSSIFITISPTERHGHLAIRLSRYRETDPLLDPQHATKERLGSEKTSPHWRQQVATAPTSTTGQSTRYESSSWHETLCAQSTHSPCMSASCSRVCWAYACAQTAHTATTEQTRAWTSSAGTPRHRVAFWDDATPYTAVSKHRRVESCTCT